MKFNYIVSALYLCLMTVIGCKDVIFIPATGTIDGYVTDNNGSPLAGIQVSATYDAPSQSPGQPPIPTTINSVTDNYGYYRLNDVWDEVIVTINQPGFLPVITRTDLNVNDHPSLNLALDGSPTIGILTLSKSTLTSASLDTIAIRVEVKDVFNTNSGGIYTANFLLTSQTGATMAMIPATLFSQGLDQYLFDALLISGEYPIGTYGLLVEVQDPDGNRQQIDPGQNIIVE